MKVTVLGAAGGIGQPLSLLLKSNPLIASLSLFDIVNTPGVAADLSHINTNSSCVGYVGDAELESALTGAQVVVIPAGVPRKPGMSRDDLFNINAGIIKNLATAAAKFCPKAYILVISNPVNSTVPIFAEVFKAHGVYDAKKILGVTTLDLVRASTFVCEIKGGDPSKLYVPVIGGHSGATIVPVLSATGLSFTQEEVEKLTQRIQFGGDEVVKAKNGAGSATLSMAYAGARFTNTILEALILGKVSKECTYLGVESVPGISYFSVEVEFGREGITKILPLPKLSTYETELFGKCCDELKSSIQKGKEFVQKAAASL